MPTSISITDFRRDMFDYAEATLATAFSFDVYKDNKALWKVIPIKNDQAERAAYVLKYVLPKVGGIWKDIPEKKFKKWKNSLRGIEERKIQNW